MEKEDNGIGAAIVTMMGGLLVAALQNAGNDARLREQNAFSERMAEDAFNRQMTAFAETQSIQSKVSQARESGVNPASLFGSLASGSVPSVQQAATPAPFASADLMGLVSTITNLVMRGKELDIQEMVGKSQARKNEADAAKAESETKTIDLERDFIPALRNGQIDVLEGQFNLMYEQISTEQTKQELNMAGVSEKLAHTTLTLIEAEIEKGSKDAKIAMANAMASSAESKSKMDAAKAEYADKYARAELNVMTSQATLNYANAQQVKDFCEQYFEGKNAIGQSLFQELTLGQINELQSCLQLNDARTGLVWKQGQETDAKIKKIAAEIGKLNADTALTTMDVKWYTFHAFNEALTTSAKVMESCVPDFNVSTTSTTTTKGKGVTNTTSTTRSYRGKN